MRRRFSDFMLGRYGPDQLYFALFVIAILLGLLSSITRFYILSLLSYLVLIFAIYRFFSRNIVKRRAENDVFLRYWGPVRYRFRRFKERLKSRKTHKFFKCPKCGVLNRIPRGKGKIEITCPRCGEKFIRKS